MKVLDKHKTIDVLFIAEGTYPYVRGGVSTWIHQIITGMPDLSFGVLFLGSREEDYGEIKYQLPENLVYLENFYMFSETELPPPHEREGSPEVYRLRAFFEEVERVPPELSDYFFYTERVTLEDVLYGRETWRMLEDLYQERGITVPFVDYFWTMRNILVPLWIAVKGATSLLEKPIRLVHSPSTGYAGFLGSLLRKTRGLPFIVTEHGIYTRERKLDIMSARWLKRLPRFLEKKYDVDDLRKLWIKFFENLGKLTYELALEVFSLYEGARQVQIKLGCPPEKTRVIPNGVEVERYKPLRRTKGKPIPPVVALIGRVTPIKDVKTFIKAMKVLVDKMPQAEGWVVGPEDEDPAYAQECRALVKALKLEGKVKFLGFKKLTEVFPRIGLTTLTSISEGMPMVVLESFAAGVPCVTTDVGSCRQLIYGGLNEEDKALGKAGEVVNVADFKALAENYRKFLSDETLWWSASEVAVKRVERFYTFEQFIRNYRGVYEKYLSEGGEAWQASALSSAKS
ncbi:MAG: DUF3492 domain-containing protein [Aquificae bacterium]|nr:DUF3492 domain-containing protein [Aquificota bacterium]